MRAIILWGLRLLRRDVLRTRDVMQADRSVFIYAETDRKGEYSTSPLGIINGLLRQLGFVIVVFVDSRDPRNIVRPYVSVRRTHD